MVTVIGTVLCFPIFVYDVVQFQCVESAGLEFAVKHLSGFCLCVLFNVGCMCVGLRKACVC